MSETYIITRQITKVSGYQTFTVEADSYEDAARKCLDGKAEFDDESIDVEGLSRDCEVYKPDDRRPTVIRSAP